METGAQQEKPRKEKGKPMTDLEIMNILNELSSYDRLKIERMLIRMRPKPKSEHRKALDQWNERVSRWPTDDRYIRAALVGATAKEHPCRLAGHAESDCPERKANR